jgi:hypothetical protein
VNHTAEQIPTFGERWTHTSNRHRLERNNKTCTGETERCGLVSTCTIRSFIAGYHVNGAKSSGYIIGNTIGLSRNLENRRLHLIDTKSLGNIKCPLSFTAGRAGRSGDRIPEWAIFSARVQTCPGAHPASCTMSTGSFQGVKSGRSVTQTPHPY